MDLRCMRNGVELAHGSESSEKDVGIGRERAYWAGGMPHGCGGWLAGMGSFPCGL